ncbi:hypothetical protein U2F26_32910 [Micromonospora sp. 4G57]|uniref:Uncharacterized protein n=1 Tax=Micromonospora sicca TaxID=2202420 RepID=A0ABU5JNG0_9ACTN|nr:MULTISPECIES: hypothetical protein [unclassified Micromonospora]MDZ5447451.1 hypothetical protein [Micromonospora sp. 4G57]MDZ5494175.1 hypothetical protein [Micromonospora sp. 4G53]
MNPDSTWQYEVRTDGDARTIVLSGEIDINGAGELHRLLGHVSKSAVVAKRFRRVGDR